MVVGGAAQPRQRGSYGADRVVHADVAGRRRREGCWHHRAIRASRWSSKGSAVLTLRASLSRSFTVVAFPALAVAVLGSSTARAATPVETLSAATPVAAYDGTAMWSRLDAATGKYQLVQSVAGGGPSVVAVPQRSGPFDIDLGSNLAGATYAVYSRRGDIYRLNPRTAVETKLTKLSSRLVEGDPTIRRGRIAFLRIAGGKVQVRIGDTTSSAKGTRLLLERAAIEGVDLGDKQITWIGRSTKGLASSRYRVHIRNLATGKDRMIYQAGGGGASFTTVTRPTFTADRSGVLWAVARKGMSGSRIVRYTLRTGELSYAHGSPSYASMAWFSEALGAIVSSEPSGDPYANPGECGLAEATCTVQYTGPLSFDLEP